MSHALALFALSLIGADPAPAPRPTSQTTPEARETWPLTLRDAIRIGLDNSEIIRVIALGGPTSCSVGGQDGSKPDASNSSPIVIARLNADASPWRFKAEVMAEVRSIEQQYWSLAQQYAQLRASEKAVELAEEILKREQSELVVGHTALADEAEIKQRLEQFRLDVVTRTSDVITTEKQLRNLLGLPPSDGRRIVPVSTPTETKVEPEWDACLAAMLEKQPDIAQQKELAKQAEAKATAAYAEATWPIGRCPDSWRFTWQNLVTPAEQQVAKQREFLQQVVRQTTHSLARFFLEIDANDKQFQTAKKFRAAAAQRLEAQRAFYEEGRITIDRYLDAVSQYANAVAQEAQFKTSYNISIVALEEAKGTLLAYENVAVTEPVRPAPVDDRSRDEKAKAASFEGPEPACCDAKAGHATVGAPQAHAPGKTVSFQMTVGVGGKPIEIKGSFTVTPAAHP
jgi:hypothetical protein